MVPGLTRSGTHLHSIRCLPLQSGFRVISRTAPISVRVQLLYPYDPSQSYIKRVIGLPGDDIRIDQGTVFVNGGKLDEPYVPAEYRDHRSVDREIVPADHYFVLGDHRSSSNDSRVWGFVSRKEIYGKAVFIYWPPDKIGRVH